ATAQELADELGRFLADEPIRARPVGTAGKTWRWCRRKPALASALLLVLLLLLVVGIGSPIAVLRINRARLQAQTKAKEATDSLWYSYLAQARAGRWSGRAGRRFESLEALRKAAELRPTLELRNEAIACLALTDLRVTKPWPIGRLGDVVSLYFDPTLEHYAEEWRDGIITVRRVNGD